MGLYDLLWCSFLFANWQTPTNRLRLFPHCFTLQMWYCRSIKWFIFFLLTGEKYFPSICSRSCSHFRHIIRSVTFLAMWMLPSTKCLLYLRAESLHFVFIHIQCKGKLLAWCSYNMRPFCVRQTDKWTAWLPSTVSWSFLLKFVLMNYLHAGSCAVLALDLEAGMCIIMKTCRGVLEQHNHHITLSNFQLCIFLWRPH